jgi:hypothetical protein
MDGARAVKFDAVVGDIPVEYLVQRSFYIDSEYVCQW